MELKLLTPRTAAERLGIGEHLIYQAVRKGDLETLEVDGQSIIFTETAFLAWVQKRLDGGNRVDVADGAVVTAAELAELAGVSPITVRGWIRRGMAKGVKVRGNWCMRWDEARRIAREKGFLAQLEALESEKKKSA